MTNISQASAALGELKKSAAAADKQHYDTLAAALQALGNRVKELEHMVQAIDHAEGMAAATAGFAATLPGADRINVADATAMAQQLAPPRLSTAETSASNPATEAEFNVKRIADLAKLNKSSKS